MSSVDATIPECTCGLSCHDRQTTPNVVSARAHLTFGNHLSFFLVLSAHLHNNSGLHSLPLRSAKDILCVPVHRSPAEVIHSGVALTTAQQRGSVIVLLLLLLSSLALFLPFSPFLAGSLSPPPPSLALTLSVFLAGWGEACSFDTGLGASHGT